MASLLGRVFSSSGSRQDKAGKSLHAAADSGDLGKVRSLLSSGTDPDVKGVSDLTPLQSAAYQGFIDTARLLIEHGASLSAKAANGRAALHFAACTGKTDMARLLLEEGADRNAICNEGLTALETARSKGHNEFVQLLESVEQAGRPTTQLHDAAGVGDTNKVKSLLSSGTDPNIKGANGVTPLHEAAYAGHIDTAWWLIDYGASLVAKSDTGMTALHFAASGGRSDMAKYLLEEGADRSAVDNEGLTALEFARIAGRTEFVRLFEAVLLQTDSTVIHTNGPLHTAAESGNTEGVSSLLANGTDPNIKGTNDLTPLHAAAYAGYVGTAWLLLEGGASLSVKAANGRAALHFAAFNEQTEMVMFLLEEGADRSAKDNEGKTALDIARSKGMDEIVRLLEPLVQTDRSKDTSSAFLAKFCEFTDDMHPAVVLEQLWPLISNTPELQLYYTAASVAYRQGRINEIERNSLIKKGLHVAVNTAVNRESIVVFKLAIEHAHAHGYIKRHEQLGLDNDAEVNRMSEAPFVKDMKSCIIANANTIALMNERLNAHEEAINQNRHGILHVHNQLDAHAQAIERNANNIRATSNALNDFKRAYKQQKKVESMVKFLKFAVNVVSMGVGGELADIGIGIIRSVTNVGSVFDHIIDLSDAEALCGLVNSMGSGRLPFDPVEFLKSDSVTAFAEDHFYDKVTDMRESVYEKSQMRQVKALEGLCVAAFACSVTTFEADAETSRAPAHDVIPTPAPVSAQPLSTASSAAATAHVPLPTPSASSSVAAPKLLCDFLEENELQEARDELTKHGYKTVRALRRTAEGQGNQASFTAHMRSEGVKLSGGDFAELYAALMDI